MQGNFLKVFNTYLVGINQANGFKTYNELTMYPLGNYPLAPSVSGDPRLSCRSEENIISSPSLTMLGAIPGFIIYEGKAMLSPPSKPGTRKLNVKPVENSKSFVPTMAASMSISNGNST